MAGYRTTAETAPAGTYLDQIAGQTGLRITFPMGGTQVPVFDVLGTAPPGSTVNLWVRRLPDGEDTPTGGGEGTAAVADENGQFVFDGEAGMRPGDVEVFVKMGEEESNRVTVKVYGEWPVDPDAPEQQHHGTPSATHGYRLTAETQPWADAQQEAA